MIFNKRRSPLMEVVILAFGFWLLKAKPNDGVPLPVNLDLIDEPGRIS